MRGALVLIAALASPAAAQQAMPGMTMPGMTHGMTHGMTMPAKKKPAPKPPAPEPAPHRHAPAHAAKPRAKAATPPATHDMSGMEGMSGMDHATMPAMDMPAAPAGAPAAQADGMADMPGMAMPGAAPGATLPAGHEPAPPPPMDHYADRTYPAAEMDRARAIMMRESGGASVHQILFNLAELQLHDGRARYRWDGEAWFGGDIDRLVVKSEGEGGRRVDAAEIQALFSRAIDPYFNLQAGIRHDLAPSATRTYATIGIEGLAPYEIETSAALFLSDRGELLARIEGWYDQRVTQRLVLQPRVELNFAAQSVAATRVGAGLSTAELGLRLRYEIAREFAPYVGMSWDAKTGRSADFARADGDTPATLGFVAGVRFWF